MKFFEKLIDSYRVWNKRRKIRKNIKKLPFQNHNLIRNVEFLENDYPTPFDRYLLLEELNKKNPHIKDFYQNGKTYTPYLTHIAGAKPEEVEVDDSCPGYKGKECDLPRKGHELCINCFRDSINDMEKEKEERAQKEKNFAEVQMSNPFEEKDKGNFLSTATYNFPDILASETLQSKYEAKSNDELARVINVLSKFSNCKEELSLAREIATKRVDKVLKTQKPKKKSKSKSKPKKRKS